MHYIDPIYDYVKDEIIKENFNFDKVYNKCIKKYDKEDIDLIFYEFNMIYNNEKKIFESKEKRINQDQFRENIIKRDKKCILTGSNSDMCEACHIIPYSDSNNIQKYDINNGLLLERGIHNLFDKHLWSINNDSIVVVSDKILNNESYKLINYCNKKKLLLNKKQLEYLDIHYNIFLSNDI